MEEITNILMAVAATLWFMVQLLYISVTEDLKYRTYIIIGVVLIAVIACKSADVRYALSILNIIDFISIILTRNILVVYLVGREN